MIVVSRSFVDVISENESILRYHICILPVLLCSLSMIGCARQAVSVSDVDKLVKAKVPLGSDKQTIKKFIDDLKIGSLKIGRDDFHAATRTALGNRDPERISELGDRIAEFTGAVIFRARSDGILTFDDIIIQFYVDREGHMIGYTVKQEGAE